ncbi:MAG TPA: PilZ domain-containing protein [bacterium]|nr:PilZ domain-containing protein [bacterium]
MRETRGDMFIERRKFKRVEKKYTIRYKLMPKENTLDTIKDEGWSRDISVGGVRVEGSPVGSVGDVLRVEFSIDTRPAPIVTFAEIKWIRGDGENKEFGLEFLALKTQDKDALEQISE